MEGIQYLERRIYERPLTSEPFIENHSEHISKLSLHQSLVKRIYDLRKMICGFSINNNFYVIVHIVNSIFLFYYSIFILSYLSIYSFSRRY